MTMGALTALTARPAAAQDTATVRSANDSVTIHLVDTDLRAAIQTLGATCPRPW